MGNKSRRRARVSGSSVKPPPRAPSWIYTGNGRGYDFINLDQVRDGRACMRPEGTEFSYAIDQQGKCAIYGRVAEDVIAHLVLVGTDVTGAAEVLRDRLGQNIREALNTLYILEEKQLEAFHMGRNYIDVLPVDGDGGLCESCDAGPSCNEYREGRTGTCEGHREREGAGAVLERRCRICGCTNAASCVDPNGMGPGEPAPCHWVAEDLCSACEPRAERLERLEEGQKKFIECNSCVHVPVCREWRDIDRAYPCMKHIPFTKKPATGWHDPATSCAHDDKEECDDCNDCGAVLEERPRVQPYHLRREAPALVPDPAVDAMIDRLRNSIGKPTNCLKCAKVDQPSCTWSNGGPAPCPGFERDTAAAEIPKALEVLAGAADIVGTSADRARCWYGENCHRFPRCFGCSLRDLRDRTSPARPADVLEVTGETSEALIERVRACGVFRGLQQRGALFGKDYCNVGHEMKDPACACCEYLRIASSPPPRKMTAEELAAGHEAHDLAGGRAGGAGGEGDRKR